MRTDLTYTAAEVADRLAIQDIINRYVHALDTREFDVMDDVFLPDCKFDLSQAGGESTSWSDVKQYWSDNGERCFPHYFHTFHNILITFNEGRSEATSVSKVINPTGIMGDDGIMHHFDLLGHYHDSWRKIEHGWRISSRRWENLWIAGDYPFSHLPGDFSKTGTIGAPSDDIFRYIHGADRDGKPRISPVPHSIKF